MLEALDVRTLLVVVGVVILLASVGMARFAQRFPRFPGMSWIAAADLLLALGILLVITRDVWPDWLTTVLANLLALLGLMLNAEGLRRFAGGAWPWWSRPYMLLLIHVPVMAWFTFVDPDVRIRVLAHTGLVALVLGSIALALWRSGEGAPMRLVTLAFAVFAAWMAFRWGVALLQPPMPSFMGAGGLHALGLVAYAVFVLVKDFGLLQNVVRRSLDEAEHQARTDPLTGLLNRRALTDMGERLLAQSRRRAEPLALVMMDIDHFKQINDQHGHAVGDAVLAGVARLLEANVRAGDACARLGGEEFVVLLPNTPGEQARQVAEKLRSLVETRSVDGVPPCTASFGVSSIGPGEDIEALLRAADRALYRAKAGGRNRVERS